MSKQKKLNNRLDDLFAGMGEETAQVSNHSDSIPGWTWKCDADGIYISCSSEVKKFLGVNPSLFIGKKVTDYQLSLQSSIELNGALRENGPSEIEINLEFLDASKSLVPTQTHIVRQIKESGITHGWKGFTRVTQEEIEIFPTDPTFQPVNESIIAREADPLGVNHKWIQPTINADPAIPHTASASQEYERISKNIQGTHSWFESKAGDNTPDPTITHVESLELINLLDQSPEREWNQDELSLVEEVSQQLNQALENARLFQDTQISLSRTESLYEVSRKIMAIDDIKELLQSVVNTISAVLPSDRTIAAVFDFPKNEIIHYLDSNAQHLEIDANTYNKLMTGLTGYCLQERKPVIRNKGSIPGGEFNTSQVEPGSIMISPLIYQDQTFGTLTAINQIEHPDFIQSDVDLLSAMSNQIAAALANAQSFQLEQRRRQIAATLSEIARIIGGFLEYDQIGESLLSLLAEVVDFYSAQLMLIQDGQREIIAKIEKEDESGMGSILSKKNQQRDDELIQSVIDNKQALLISNTNNHPLWNDKETPLPQVGTWYAIPLLQSGTVLGILILEHTAQNAYDVEAQDLLSGIAAQASIALQNALLYQQAQNRSAQLQTAAEVSRAASSILDPNPLIQQTANLIRDRFDLYYVGVFLIDENGIYTQEPGKWAVLRAGTGDAGRIMMARNHKLEVGGISMIGVCVNSAEAQISQHAIAEEQRFTNPILPETRSEMALPLISRSLVIGAMTIQSTQASAFSHDDIAILQTMADQVANALQNASLFDQIQIRAEELAVLNEMSRQLTATVDFEAISRNIYLFTSRLIDTSTFYIALLDEATSSIRFPFATRNNQEITTARLVEIQGLAKEVLDNKQPFLTNDLVNDPLLRYIHPEDGESQNSNSWLGVPMLAGDAVIGVISVQHPEPFFFHEQDMDLLTAIASQSAIAYQNASLFEQIRQRGEELQLINRIVSRVSSSLDLAESLQIVVDEVGRITNADSGGIAILDKNRTTLTLLADYIPQPGTASAVGLQLPLSSNPASQEVFRTRKPLIISDAQINPILQSIHAPLRERNIETMMLYPLIVSDEVIGTIGLDFSKKKRILSESETNLVQTIIVQAATAIQNARLFQQVRRQLRDLETISRASQTLSGAPLETSSVAEIIAQIFIELFGTVTSASISLISSEINNLMETIVSLRRMGENTIVDPELERWDFSLDDFPATTKVMENQEPLLVQDNNSEVYPSEWAEMEEQEVNTLVIFPLAVKRQSIGIIKLKYHRPYDLSNEELTLGLTLANQSAVALENARLYVEQRETTEQLREIDTLKSQFLANMSHELRTPLNSIIGFSRVIMKGIDGPVTDIQQQDLSAIYNAGQHLLNMINDILDISKIEAGKMELAFDNVQLTSIIESVLSTARGLLKDKPIQLKTDIEDDLPVIKADPTRIRQILLNLLSNASKFTKEGSITVAARKHIPETGGHSLYIAVSDTGTGIDSVDQQKLFMPFSQVDGSSTRKVEGTGLGLSITRMLVELHGGDIGVISNTGEGSTFWFTIPVQTLIQDPIQEGHNTIISIDNDLNVIQMYEHYLINAGFETIAITDPKEAIETARQTKPLAITLDIYLKDHDGWALLRELKEDPITRDIPVIICSLLAESDKGIEEGAADYLIKPILEDDFLNAINNISRKLG